MKAYKLQIVTPDGMFFDGECEQITVLSIDGGVSVLADHVPYVTALAEDGWCRVYQENGVKNAFCSGGMLTVTPEITRIVAAAFRWE